MANLSIMYRVGMEVSELNKGVADVNAKLDSLSGMATEVGHGLVSAFTAGAVVAGISAMVSSSLEYAGTLSDLSVRLKMTAEDLQLLEAIGRPAGASMDDMARAASALYKNLDSKTGRDALKELGLSYEHLRSLKPTEMFTDIGQAVAGIQDPIEQANAKQALFGKTFDAVSASFAGNVDEIVRNTRRLSNEQVEALDYMGDLWDEWIHNVKVDAATWVSRLASIGTAVKSLSAIFAAARGDFSLPEPPKPPTNLRPAMKTWITDMKEIERIAKDMNQGIAESTKARERVERDAAREAEKSAEMVEASLERMRYGHFKASEAALTTATNMSPLLMRTSEFVAIGKDYSSTLTAAQIKTDGFGHALQVNVVPSLGNMGTEADQNALRVAALGDKFNGFIASIQKFPSIVVKAFTGGGGLKGAMNALGAQIGSDLFGEGGALAGVTKRATDGLSKIFRPTIGGAMGAAIPGIGALIGPAFGKLASWIGSLFGNKTKDAILESFGSYDALREKLGVLGTEGERMWIRLTQQTGRNDLASTKAQIDEINAALGLQATAMQTVDDVAKKYGLTVEELGPAWARMELDKKAQELYKDYQVLVSAGVENVVVLEKMAKSVNEYAQNAVKMGIEVPEAMRPMLETMVANGQLLDANGNKILSLEDAGIQFSMTMTEGFKALISEVQQLTDVIARSLGVSLDEIRHKSEVANQAMQDGFDESWKAVQRLNDEVDATSWGHSPGGLKDVIALGERATATILAFGRHTAHAMAGASEGIDALAAPQHLQQALHPSTALAAAGDDEDGLLGWPAPPATSGASASAGAGGVFVTIHIDASGSLFDTPADLDRLAKKVSEAWTMAGRRQTRFAAA